VGEVIKDEIIVTRSMSIEYIKVDVDVGS